jgi:outer membrane protein TolC
MFSSFSNWKKLNVITPFSKAHRKKTVPCLVAMLILAAAAAMGQTTIGYSENTSPTPGLPSGIGQATAQNPFTGSVPQGKATPQVLSLSFKDAIDLALKNNLGLLLQGDNTLSARGQKWKELSALLPDLTTKTSENVSQINLAAEGIRIPIPGFPTIIGPYSFFDTRGYLTQSLFDLHSIQREHGAAANESAARYTYKDARDLVVLTAGNAYLQCISAAARVDSSQAQVQTAQTLYDKTADQQRAGVSPAIDTLRAHVELQTRQQQLIVARNDYAKQKLALARVIGLPSGQEFTLTEQAPYEPLVALSVEQSLQRAYASRSDYQAALQQVRAAEYFRKAASSEYLPSLDLAANYGAIGLRPDSLHGTFEVSGSLTIPIFQGGKVRADVLQAEATQRQYRSQLENLRGQIDYEVRTALLDLAAAADQVEVARSSVDLADQTLIQARDRFAAGVTDNLEVVQAQESVASANESYISSLYAHNLAKLSLVRAMGYAEEGVRQYLMKK